MVSRIGALFSQYGYHDRAATALELAYRAYSRATEMNPNSEDGYVAFAEFALAHGNNDYALQVVARGLDHMPESPILLFEQGILWAIKGDRSQAENSFVKASQAVQPGTCRCLPLASRSWSPEMPTRLHLCFKKSA